MSIFLGLALPAFLAAHGLRKGSLSSSGGITAFLVGSAMMTGPLHVFGITLIVFYLSGSKATRYGKKQKSVLEDNHHEAGYRSGWQVVSNAFGAVLATLAWNLLFVPTGLHAQVLAFMGLGNHVQNLSDHFRPSAIYPGFCPVDPGNMLSKRLLFAVLGHFACCMGDTLASELGILSKSPPRLITTGAVVPPGTNGGMSFFGVVASVGGGTFMGLIMAVCLALESLSCRSHPEALLKLIAWGAFAGNFGSMVDSFLGATIQSSKYSESKKCIVEKDTGKKGDVKVISGLNILTNNQVNLVSSVVTAALMAYLA